jgi:hypothetical protein
MPQIAWNQNRKQVLRQERFTRNYSLSPRKQGLIGYIMPTPKRFRSIGEYNVTVPAMGNQRFSRVKKTSDPGTIGSNGTGITTPPIRVGTPVLVNFLGNKNQPVITDAFPYGGDPNREKVLDPDPVEQGGALFYPAQNTLSKTFEGWGQVSPLILRGQSPNQPQNSPVQNEVPGSYEISTDDGKKYQVQVSNDISLFSDRTEMVEGKRQSIITRPVKVANLQAEKLPYTINSALDRFYSIADGQFLPEDIRRSPVGDEWRKIFDPALNSLELMEEFYVGAQEYVDSQIEWFETNIIDTAEQLFELWAETLSKGDILDLFGFEGFELEVSVVGFIDQFFISAIPSTGIGLVDAGIQYGINYLKEQLAQEILEGGLSNNLLSVDFGDIGSIGISVFGGGGGSANPNLFKPSKGSMINFKPPVIFSEGSPIYETIRYGREVNQLVQQKAEEIGLLTSSVQSFIQNIADQAPSEVQNSRVRIQTEIADDLSLSNDFDFNLGESETKTISIFEEEVLFQEDEILVQTESVGAQSLSGKISKVEGQSIGRLKFLEDLEETPVTAVPIGTSDKNIDSLQLKDERQETLYSMKRSQNLSPVSSLVDNDNQDLLYECAILFAPHTKNSQTISGSLKTANLELDKIKVQVSLQEDFSNIHTEIEEFEIREQRARSDLLNFVFDYRSKGIEEDFFIRVKYKDKLIFPSKSILIPEQLEDPNYEYSVSWDLEDGIISGIVEKTPDSNVTSIDLTIKICQEEEVLEKSDTMKLFPKEEFQYEPVLDLSDKEIKVETFNPATLERRVNDQTETTPEAPFTVDLVSKNYFLSPYFNVSFEFNIQTSREISEVLGKLEIESLSSGQLARTGRKSFIQNKKVKDNIILYDVLPKDDYRYRVTLESDGHKVSTEWQEFSVQQASSKLLALEVLGESNDDT